MKRVFILLFIFSLSMPIFADSASERKIRKADLLTYSLVKAGVKTLQFKMKVQGLKENLNKRKNFGEIKELYFSVSWTYPQKMVIKVFGMPKGFKEMKDQLKMAVYARIPLLFPIETTKMISGYKMEYSTKNNVITAIDPTGKKIINQVKVVTLDNGMLKSLESLGTSGSQLTSYEGQIESWSKKKFVYNKIQLEIKEKAHKTVVKHALKYRLINGFGVPTSIDSTTTVVNLEDNKKKILSKVETVFYDYLVNGVK